tara:strand:- start:192 stop:1319 length:1128 start_codon:yes stop_codon:yes gene_type:complete
MKESDWTIIKKTHDASWIRKNVLHIKLQYIEEESGGTQVRQDGTDSTHVEQLCHSILTFGQQVPITVEIAGERDDGTTIYRIVDGNHRYKTIKKLNKDDSSDHRWREVQAIIKKFKNDYERIKYQTNANAHETPVKVSSDSDALVVLKNIIDVGLPGAPKVISDLHGSAGRNLTDPRAYEKDLKAGLKVLFPGLSNRQRSSVVRKLQGKELPGKFGRWTAGLAQEEFITWAENEEEININNDFLHTVKNLNYIDWQLIARVFASRSDDQEKQNSENENIVIMYWSEISNKNNSELNEHRRKMIDKINKRNNSWFLKHFKGKRAKVIDRVFIAPQKRDSKCEELGFYEVKKNKKGNFASSKLPTRGWNTVSKKQAA